MEFLYSLNRLNVATSRARCVAIVVASPALFRVACHTPRQMQLANALCRLVEVARDQRSAGRSSSARPPDRRRRPGPAQLDRGDAGVGRTGMTGRADQRGRAAARTGRTATSRYHGSHHADRSASPPDSRVAEGGAGPRGPRWVAHRGPAWPAPWKRRQRGPERPALQWRFGMPGSGVRPAPSGCRFARPDDDPLEDRPADQRRDRGDVEDRIRLDASASVLKMPMNGATKIWLMLRMNATRSLPSRAFSRSRTMRRTMNAWMIPKIRTTTRRSISPPLGDTFVRFDDLIGGRWPARWPGPRPCGSQLVVRRSRGHSLLADGSQRDDRGVPTNRSPRPEGLAAVVHLWMLPIGRPIARRSHDLVGNLRRRA